jgi:putative tricarboxylic transport membrane protein
MKKDQKSSLIVLAIGLGVCLESIRGLPLGSMRSPGPGFMPVIAGALLMSLGLLEFILSSRKRSPKQGKWYPERWKTILVILGSLFLYAFLLEALGFLIDTLVLMCFLFRVIEPQKWIITIGASAGLTFGTYAIFNIWLKCQLPGGLLGF